MSSLHRRWLGGLVRCVLICTSVRRRAASARPWTDHVRGGRVLPPTFSPRPQRRATPLMAGGKWTVTASAQCTVRPLMPNSTEVPPTSQKLLNDSLASPSCCTVGKERQTTESRFRAHRAPPRHPLYTSGVHAAGTCYPPNKTYSKVRGGSFEWRPPGCRVLPSPAASRPAW